MNGSFKVGDRVRFTSEDLHRESPEWYPKVGTVGVVIRASDTDDGLLVRWPNGTTAADGRWWCWPDDVEPVED